MELVATMARYIDFTSIASPVVGQRYAAAVYILRAVVEPSFADLQLCGRCF